MPRSRLLLLCLILATPAQGRDLRDAIDRESLAREQQVISWRRDIHQHPELGNREFRTGKLVADHLESLGYEVQRMAHTGVVGRLRSGRPGPRVGLRADMDALPVTEAVDVPFASRVRTTYLGREVGVMHACGHDAHTAILMGVAEVLAALRDDLHGEVMLVFQPAEEGAPPGEKGGARLMVEEGIFEDGAPDAIFALHVVPRFEVGEVSLGSGGVMASSDRLRIVVRGRQTHAAYPWLGIDPIAAASRIVLALHRISSRRVDARIPSVVSIGAIHGGVRNNIIPDEVELLGTIRSLDPALTPSLHQTIRETATKVAESEGARAEVDIQIGYPVTYNQRDLVARSLPVLREVAGAGRVVDGLPATGAEDFSFFAREAPGAYFWLGVRPKDVPLSEAAPNHSPHFFVDEKALVLGVRALSHLTADALGLRGTPGVGSGGS